MDARIASDTTEDRMASPATLVTTILTVFLAAAGIILLSRYVHGIVGIWISNAILLAVLMKHRRRDWAWIAFAGFAANIVADLTGYSLGQAIMFACLNIL